MGGKSSGAAASALGNATPYGAAANAVKGLAAGGPSSTGDQEQGGETFGPISFGGFKSDGGQALPSWVIPVGLGLIAFTLLYSFSRR